MLHFKGALQNDTQHDDAQHNHKHNETQHYDFEHNDTKDNTKIIATLSIMTLRQKVLSFFAECHK
jgi:hypothetical protein